MKLLSILIPTLPERKPLLDALVHDLREKFGTYCKYTEILSHRDPKGAKSIGEKRNELLKRAEGKYVCFIDDDDTVTEHYAPIVIKGIEMDVDVVALRGVITTNGANPLVFAHSIKYKAYRTVTGATVAYERYPNHLNTIKASIAKQFKFPNIDHGEDTDWATQIYKSGLLKVEAYHEKIIYNYLYKTKK